MKKAKYTDLTILDINPITRVANPRGNITEPDNERAYSLGSIVKEYRDNTRFARDVAALELELSGKPLEVLEIRINREILEYLREAPTADKETQIKRKLLIQNLLTQYKFRSKDIDPAYKAYMETFDVEKKD